MTEVELCLACLYDGTGRLAVRCRKCNQREGLRWVRDEPEEHPLLHRLLDLLDESAHFIFDLPAEDALEVVQWRHTARRQEKREVVWEAVKRLPQRQRELIAAMYLDVAKPLSVAAAGRAMVPPIGREPARKLHNKAKKNVARFVARYVLTKIAVVGRSTAA